jgi:hypothetical protein
LKGVVLFPVALEKEGEGKTNGFIDHNQYNEDELSAQQWRGW